MFPFKIAPSPFCDAGVTLRHLSLLERFPIKSERLAPQLKRLALRHRINQRRVSTGCKKTCPSAPPRRQLKRKTARKSTKTIRKPKKTSHEIKPQGKAPPAESPAAAPQEHIATWDEPHITTRRSLTDGSLLSGT